MGLCLIMLAAELSVSGIHSVLLRVTIPGNGTTPVLIR